MHLRINNVQFISFLMLKLTKTVVIIVIIRIAGKFSKLF